MSTPGSRPGRLDPREQQLQARVASARARLDAKAAELGTSVERIVNPVQSLRRVPIVGIAAGLATGVASGLLLSALRSRRARKRRLAQPVGVAGGAAGITDDPDFHDPSVPGAAELLVSVIPILAAWMSRARK